MDYYQAKYSNSARRTCHRASNPRDSWFRFDSGGTGQNPRNHAGGFIEIREGPKVTYVGVFAKAEGILW
jgi:hypothetical protein